MTGSRSKHQSAGPELEMNSATKFVDRNGYSNIEKTVEWEVTDTQRNSRIPEHTVQSQESWLDDSDGIEKPERSLQYGSTTEITKSSFGLRR